MSLEKNKKRAMLALVVALVAGMLAIAACTPSKDEAPAEPGTTEAETTVAEWSPDLDCATCHGSEAASVEDSALLASNHSTSTCTDCHSVDSISELHESVTGAPTEEQAAQMKKRGRTMGTKDFCLTCHGSLEELAAKTAASTALEDTRDTAVNPHAIPMNAEHEDGRVNECFNCHSIHTSSPSPVPGCTGCHHAGVFECGTCHEV